MARRRNPTFFHEHPWMTFFLGMGVLGAIKVVARGWEPSLLPSASSSSSSTPSSSSATPQVVDAASHPIVKAGA